MDSKLVALIAAGTLLFLGHTVDHAIRDELRWVSPELLVFALIDLVVFGAIGASLYLYRKGKVGPRFWAVLAFTGVVLGWAGHFSPFTAQGPSYILGAYGYGLVDASAALAIVAPRIASVSTTHALVGQQVTLSGVNFTGTASRRCCPICSPRRRR